MTEEAQRIAIAEACGWTSCTQSVHGVFGYVPDANELDSQGALENKYILPNYLSDLNAMHEAEKVLTEYQMEDYCRAIKKIVCKEEFACGYRYYFCATAAQRTEAFLRTLNLWKDNEK